ncbi:MAG: type II secretion system protein [Clostridiales bacterium]|nr:type II secretion system protein [Clostridiales bacterium]
MRRNDRGFTLVEILVVVAIMGVLAGVLSLSLNTVFSSRARRCAYSTDAYIDMCRINTLSRAGNVYIELTLDGDDRVVGSYYEDSDPTDGVPPVLKSTELLSGGGVEVIYKVGGTNYTLSSSTPLTLAFNRETGGLKPVSGTNYCTEIRVISGRTYTITLVPSTGGHYIS